MSDDWLHVYIPRKYLGRMTEKGYYIQIPGGHWYIIASTRLVRVNDESTYFVLTLKEGFTFKTAEKTKDSTGTIREINSSKLTGKDIVQIFEEIN